MQTLTVAQNAPQSQPLPSVTTLPLSEGDAGTVETLQHMCRLIDEGAKDPEINRTAIAIVHAAGVKQFDFEGERRAIYAWIRKNIRFFRDIDGKETLRSSRETLATRGGDCDDYTILTCALLKTIGQRVRIVTISSHGQAPEVFSHVFPEVRNERGRWIPMDNARRQAAYGLGPNHWYRRREWDTEDGSYADIAGLGFYQANTFPLPTTGRGRFLLQPGAQGYPSAAGGLGAYPRRGVRRRNLRGLGFDWSTLVSAIPAITSGTANIISAERASPINLMPNVGTGTGTLTPAAEAQLALEQQSMNPLSAISPTTLLLIGGGLLVAVMMMNKRN